jgi:hypothetical protein
LIELVLRSGKTDVVTLKVEVHVGNALLAAHDFVFLPSSGCSS